MWDRLSTHPRNTGELLNNLAIAKLEQQQAISELDTLKDSVASDYLDVLDLLRSEEHTSELQSLMRISYAVFCLKKKKKTIKQASIILKRMNTKHKTCYNTQVKRQ